MTEDIDKSRAMSTFRQIILWPLFGIVEKERIVLK